MLLAHLAVTGGLHLDGLADYIDAVAAGARGEKATRIMHDPHRGAAAITHTATILAARAALYATLHNNPTIIIAAYTAATQAMYITTLTAPPRQPGLGQLFHNRGTRHPKPLTNALLYAALATLTAILDPTTLATHATAIATALLAAHDAKKRGIGATGDALGFTYETTLTTTLLTTSITLHTLTHHP